MLIYRVGKVICYLYFKLVHRLTVEGKEHFPKKNGVLLCSNHLSYLDPPLLGVASPRKIRFMAKSELFSIPLFNSLITTLGAFPVKRGLSDKQALRSGIEILNNGEVMGIFPEGTRSKTGKLGPGLAGAGFFALRSNAVVVPCLIAGSYRPFKKVKVIFGKPIDFSAKEKRISAKEAAEIIMEHIRDLVEEEKRNI